MQYKNLILFAVTLSCIRLTGLQAQTIKDIDGNVYKIVTIGTQVWMAENLKTTKYNDGRAIPNVKDHYEWRESTTSAYCWYNNDIANKYIYGALYNWFTVNTGKLCPKGWHVPTDAQWTILTTFLGGDSVAGGKLKETDATKWTYPNTGAINASRFTALPGGCRNDNGTYLDFGIYGYWWSSTEYNSSAIAHFRYMSYDLASVNRRYYFKESGYSVRCLRDN